MQLRDDSSTNLSLIDRVQADDSRAWHELVDLYGPLVAYWCRKLDIPEASVSDCVQNVFMAVLRSLPSFVPQGYQSGFRGWLWGLTRHKCLDFRRSNRRHPDAPGGSEALQQQYQWQAPEDWSELTEDVETSRLMHRAMRQIEHEFATKTWTAFWRTTVDGISTSIVAQELELPTSTIRQYRSRILRRLRKQLGDLS